MAEHEPMEIDHTGSNDTAAVDQNNHGLQQDIQDYKLIGVVVFFRHGARTPLHYFETKVLPIPQWTIENHATEIAESQILLHPQTLKPSMAMNLILPGGAPGGALTRAGQMQLFRLGQEYRRRYGPDAHKNSAILPKVYSPKHIYNRSSAVPRNILSTRCFLAGLFSPTHFKEHNAPVVIDSVPSSQEILYPNMMRYKQLEAAFREGKLFAAALPEVIKMKEKLKEVLEVPCLVDKLNPGADPMLPVYQVRDDLAARQFHGEEMPPALKEIWSEMEAIACTELLHEFFGVKKHWHLTVRYAIGPVFELIQSDLETLKVNHNAPRMLCYATHDSLLLPVLFSWGLRHGEWPPFGADLSIELYVQPSKSHHSSTPESSKALSPSHGNKFFQALPHPHHHHHSHPQHPSEMDYWIRLVYCGEVQDATTVYRVAVAPLVARMEPRDAAEFGANESLHCRPEVQLISWKAFNLVLARHGVHIAC